MRLDGKIVDKLCNGCGNYKAIAHQKLCLCIYCNSKRLVKDREERKKERELRQSLTGEKPTVKDLKQTYSIRNLSNKGRSQKAKLHAVYKKIDAKAYEEGRYYCWSCGSTNRPLSHSHTISVGQRKDLELDEDNIILECMDWGGVRGCHTIWEHGTLSEKKNLLTFNSKLEYIKRMDTEKYIKLTQ